MTCCPLALKGKYLPFTTCCILRTISLSNLKLIISEHIDLLVGAYFLVEILFNFNSSINVVPGHDETI